MCFMKGCPRIHDFCAGLRKSDQLKNLMFSFMISPEFRELYEFLVHDSQAISL